MLKVDPETDPINDIDAEYNRLVERYGLHPDMPLPFVEKVYGGIQRFRAVVRQFKGTEPKDVGRLLGGEDEPEENEDLTVAEMNGKQLKDYLRENGVTFHPRANLDQLRDLAEGVAAG